jgi:cell division protein ZipA
MWELRWVLIGLGGLVFAGIYLWPRLRVKLGQTPKSGAEPQAEPPNPEPGAIEENPLDGTDWEPRAESTGPNKVITVRIIPKAGEEISAELAVLALRKAGLEHGKYGIFHYPLAENEGEPEFSAASLIEPGSFDLTNLKVTSLPGMSFFMILPGFGDPVSRFDRMVGLARTLAKSLNAELFDEHGSSWNIQRERYVREEIIEYCHRQTRV